MVLLMTVNPGFGGQKFISSVLPKIAEVKQLADEQFNPNLEIEIDGGVNEETAKLCIEQGANVLVAGSAVYNQADRAEAIRKIRGNDKNKSTEKPTQCERLFFKILLNRCTWFFYRKDIL